MSDVEVLAVGALTGGPGSDRRWVDAVTEIGRQIRDLRKGVTSPLAVNVVYQIPGPNLHPDFEGVRTGKYSQIQRRLMVQVALPPTTELRHYDIVYSNLLDAVTAAEHFAIRRQITDQPLHELRTMVRNLIDV